MLENMARVRITEDELARETHAVLADLHDKLSRQHTSMLRHYSTGAQGAHTADANADEEKDELPTVHGPLEETDTEEPTDARSIVRKVLRDGVHFGDPSRAGFYLTRARERGRS